MNRARMLLDSILTVVVGLCVAVVCVALAPLLFIYVIASNWDWEHRV